MVNGANSILYSSKVKKNVLYKHALMNQVVPKLTNLNLNIIEEGSEEEDEDSEDEISGVWAMNKVLFTPAQVAQAFSHFSYIQSDRKRLVCDLQGVYDEGENLIQFSDPVIHYYNPRRINRRCVHGRTDRGRNGIVDFLATHCCADQDHLCQLLTRGLRSVRRNHHRTAS